MSIPNVKEIRVGYFVYCKKVRGRQHYVPLPAPQDPKFPAAYARAAAKIAKVGQNPDVRPGTFGALLIEYRSSSDFQSLSQTTRSNYERYLDMVEAAMGKAPVKDLKTSRVERMRDEMQAKPGKANNWLKVLRAVLDLGVRRDYVTANVAAPVPLLEIGEHDPWPQEVLDRVLAHVQPTTRLAIQTGLYSGQRISDCIRFTHAMLEQDTIHLVQKKTRSKGDKFVDVFIPVHPEWRAAVAAVPRRADTILYDRSGRPFKNPSALQERIRDAMKALGYVDEVGEAAYTFHGLRKNNSNYLAEIGLNEAQIGAMNGMVPGTVQHYTKRARKRLITDTARERVLAGSVANRA